jgi:hypothetical protein
MNILNDSHTADKGWPCSKYLLIQVDFENKKNLCKDTVHTSSCSLHYIRLHYLGNDIDCSLNHCWLLNIEQHEIHLVSREVVGELTLHMWGPSAHIVIFLKIPHIQFYLWYSFHKSLKFNQNLFLRKS